MKAVKGNAALASPTVGRWDPRVQRGAQLREGLVLGVIVRLGRPLEIVAPAGGGQVVEVLPAGWLQYGEVLVEIGLLGADVPTVLEEQEGHEGLVAVRAPMAGTIYQRPTPADPPFVEVGVVVKRLQTLALMEVMKTFTPIKADQAGTLERWGVDDGGSVEAETPVAWIRPG